MVIKNTIKMQKEKRTDKQQKKIDITMLKINWNYMVISIDAEKRANTTLCEKKGNNKHQCMYQWFNGIETEKQYRKINETKNCSFKNISKIDQPITRLTRWKQERNITNIKIGGHNRARNSTVWKG